MHLTEGMLRDAYSKACLGDIDLPGLSGDLAYADAMRDYGSDRPDLRNPLKLVDIADLMAGRGIQSVSTARPTILQGRVVALLRAGRRRACRAGSSTTLHRVRRPLRRERDLPTSKVNDLAAGVEGLAVADTQVSAG